MKYFSAAKKPEDFQETEPIMLSIIIKWKTSTTYKNIYE